MRRFSTVVAGTGFLSVLLAAGPVVAAVPATGEATNPPHAVAAVLTTSQVTGATHAVAVTPVADGDDFHDHVGRGGLGWVFAGPYWNPYWGPAWGPAWGWDPGWGWGWNGPAYEAYDNVGAVRLEIKGPNPKNAEVFVNGGYAGVVASFDRWYQSLRLAPGTYDIKIEAKGYQSLDFKVAISPGQTIDYKAALKPAA
jgi:hypothetical protein